MATNSNVMLMDTVHSLPGATFSCTGSVNNARGVWNGPVAKTEMGKLIYNSLVGGGTLDVQQGTFKIVPKEPRAKLAGLNEGDIFSDSANTIRVAVGADSTTASAITNRLAMGATALYDEHYRDFWCMIRQSLAIDIADSPIRAGCGMIRALTRPGLLPVRPARC